MSTRRPEIDGESAAWNSSDAPEVVRPVQGERGIPSVNRIRSMQSRVTALLAVGFVSLVVVGALAWYYTHEWTRTQDARTRATNLTQQRAQGEMKLPPLRIQSPKTKRRALQPEEPDPLWGAPPPPPPPNASAYPVAYRANPPSQGSRTAPPDRRLTGPVFSEEISSLTERTATAKAAGESAAPSPAVSASTLGAGMPVANARTTDSMLGDFLQPTTTRTTFAHALPTQRMLIPQGWKIDCTLETAIDSSLQGFVTCVTPVDIFGADGTTVLLERGSQLFGETRGEARQGLARVFVLWMRARTPSGVVAMLDSPGTDELGRAGLPGRVQRHFWERFGAAILISVIEGAIQRASRVSDGSTVILSPSTTGSIATEALKSTVNIPPTILKSHGDTIQVVVARDIDFRTVYELRLAADR